MKGCGDMFLLSVYNPMNFRSRHLLMKRSSEKWPMRIPPLHLVVKPLKSPPVIIVPETQLVVPEKAHKQHRADFPTESLPGGTKLRFRNSWKLQLCTDSETPGVLYAICQVKIKRGEEEIEVGLRLQGDKHDALGNSFENSLGDSC